MIKTSEELTFTNNDFIDKIPEMMGYAPEEILFLDIETTGLSRQTADLYMIGVAYFEKGHWRSCQMFAENTAQEAELLREFINFVKDFKVLVHFNGNRFDIPFLKSKFEKYLFEDPTDKLDSFDIYKKIAPYKNLLGLPDCKQKTIELYLGIDRQDQYDGGKLIPVYQRYTEGKDAEDLKLLLLHNEEDIKGLFELLPMLVYEDFFSRFRNLPKLSIRTDEEIDASRYYEDDFALHLPVKARKVQANYYNDFEGKQKKEVYMKLSLPITLPSSLTGNYDDCYFKAEGSEATLRVPLFEEELKYFYANYKDYYYLPKEDTAIHKSIASFVDKAYREKATAENCYTRKEGQYLKEWDLVFTPFFKRNYEDEDLYFDLNENMKKSRFAMSLYACHVIAHILDA
jgi:uncharacterized protein YprB with RNaseH-like and TPR domain